MVVFTVHKDRHDEATALVPLLYIILEARFGPCIWDWFTDDAKRVLTKYKWDPDEEMVILMEPDDDDECSMEIDSNNECTKEICNTLNDNTDPGGHGFEFDLKFVINEVLQPRNQYGDSGNGKTFCDACEDERTVDSPSQEIPGGPRRQTSKASNMLIPLPP